MNIFDALRGSHDTQRELTARLMRAHGASERQQAFQELKLELSAHETAEERSFYVPLFEHDETVDPARHGIAEHHEMDEMVEDLEKLETGTAPWSELMRKLVHKIEHHLSEEEDKFFQAAGRVLSEDQKLGLALLYQEEFSRLVVKEAEG